MMLEDHIKTTITAMCMYLKENINIMRMEDIF